MSILFAFIFSLIISLTQNEPILVFQDRLNELSSRTISLEKRQANPWVNSVFKDNILLNLAYLRGQKQSEPIDWNKLREPFTYKLELKPNETFAYHEDVLPEFERNIVKTTNAHFNSQEGFKSDGYLVGDGVCHLASLINWAAKLANLKSVAPSNHDFAYIPEVPKEFGVAIYNSPENKNVGANQNLYITNTKDKPITIEFLFDGSNLEVKILELI